MSCDSHTRVLCISTVTCVPCHITSCHIIPTSHHSFNVCVCRICHRHKENTHSKWRVVLFFYVLSILPSLPPSWFLAHSTVIKENHIIIFIDNFWRQTPCKQICVPSVWWTFRVLWSSRGYRCWPSRCSVLHNAKMFLLDLEYLRGRLPIELLQVWAHGKGVLAPLHHVT